MKTMKDENGNDVPVDKVDKKDAAAESTDTDTSTKPKP